jgi:hypothetical protein
VKVIPGIGAEYVYVKALVHRVQSIEEDLRAVLAQYTEDETTIRLYQATRLARLLPAGTEFTEPRQVERTAYRLYVEVLQSLSTSLSEKALILYNPYALIPIVRDVELILRRGQRGEEVPSKEELFWPESPQVQEALRLVEEGITDPIQVTKRLGLQTSYKLLSAAKTPEALSTAFDIELLKAFADAVKNAKTSISKDILGARLDILVAKTMYSLIEMKPARQVIDIYLENLTTYKLKEEEVKNAVEAFDAELAKRLLVSSPYGTISENLGVLEGFIARVRKYLRVIDKKIFTWEPVSNEPIIGLLDLLLLDAEDAVIIALMAYSRQPKERVLDLVSFA